MADSREFLIRLSRSLVDEGKLIEAGWVSLRASAMSLDAPAFQIEEMRMAFFAGAVHLWSSIFQVLDPGKIETEGDMRRMSLIDMELEGFMMKFAERHRINIPKPH